MPIFTRPDAEIYTPPLLQPGSDKPHPAATREEIARPAHTPAA